MDFQSMGYDFKNKLFDFDMVLVWSASHSQTSQVVNFKCQFYGSCTTFDSMTGFFLKVYDAGLGMSYVVVFVGGIKHSKTCLSPLA